MTEYQSDVNNEWEMNFCEAGHHNELMNDAVITESMNQRVVARAESVWRLSARTALERNDICAMMCASYSLRQ